MTCAPAPWPHETSAGFGSVLHSCAPRGGHHRQVPPCPPELATLGADMLNGATLGALVLGAMEMYRVTKDGMQRSVARANPAMEKMAIFYRVCRKWVHAAVARFHRASSQTPLTQRLLVTPAGPWWAPYWWAP
jgi:hypothetical protein